MLVSLKNNKYSSGESLDVENEFFFIYTIIQREEELGTRYFHSKKKTSTTYMQLSNTNISLFYRQKK